MPTCFFATDLHGHVDRYEKLLASVVSEHPAAVLLGGDLLPRSAFSTIQSGQADFVHDYLVPTFARTRDALGVGYPDIFLILGNDDPRREEDGFIAGAADGIWHYIHQQKFLFGAFPIYGLAYVPPTPFMLKDWERYDVSRYVPPGCVSPEEGYRSVPAEESEIKWGTIQKDLASLASEDPLDHAVFLFHTPPCDTPLDRAALDGKTYEHVPLDVHVGSIAVQRFIEERQPLLIFFGFMHPRDSWPKAKAAALQAIQIDDRIAEAHASLGMATLFYDWQPVAAQTYCRRAIELGPSSSAGRRWQACCFMALGRHDESVAAATEALELDPLSPLAHILTSTAYYFGRRYDLALAEANKALEFDPHHAESHRFKGITLLQLGELEKAIPELEMALRLMGEGPATLGSLGRAYARAGRAQETESIIARLKTLAERKGVASSSLAAVYVGQGDLEQAVCCLEKAVENRSSWMVLLKVEPWWDPLRKHPKFERLVRDLQGGSRFEGSS